MKPRDGVRSSRGPGDSCPHVDRAGLRRLYTEQRAHKLVQDYCRVLQLPTVRRHATRGARGTQGALAPLLARACCLCGAARARACRVCGVCGVCGVCVVRMGRGGQLQSAVL